MMFKLATVLLALSSGALASLFTTAPIATTSWAAGTPQTVTWEESTDGAAPTLQTMGPTSIAIYVGNAQQQTLLQSISASTNVATVSSVTFTPNATIGPNGAFYFIRFQSLSAPDPTNPLIPAEAFSAKFTLTGMTGTFTPAISSEIAGVSTAPIGPAPVTTTAAVGVTTTTRAIAATTTPAIPSAAKVSSTAKPTSAGVSSRSLSGLAVAGAAAVAGIVLF
jgi:hypothetical protein